MTDRAGLEQLTDRWRARHDARRPSVDARPPASDEREALAARAFPYRTMSPADYVATYGTEMRAYTYDDERYGDAELDAWIVEVGRLLRAAR